MGKEHSPHYSWNKKLSNEIYKKQPLPHEEPTQSIKSIKVKWPYFINNLVSNQSKYTKEAFSLWMDSTLSSKAILFLVFHIDQNKHKGPTFQTALRFLPTKDLIQKGFPNRGRKHPRHSKQRKGQLPHFLCLFAMEKKIVDGLLKRLAKITKAHLLF